MSSNSSLVMNDLLSALRGIRAGDGYNTTAAFVTEASLQYEDVGAFPALSARILRERVTHFPAGKHRRVLHVQITGFVRATVGKEKTDAARELAADVEKALLIDGTRGGHATMTKIVESKTEASAHEEGARIVCTAEIVLHE